MSPDVPYDPELSARVADLFRRSLDHHERVEPEVTADGIASSVIAELLPGPWLLAAAIRDLPPDVVHRLPEGTIQRFFELIPGITGEEARDVFATFVRSAP